MEAKSHTQDECPLQKARQLVNKATGKQLMRLWSTLAGNSDRAEQTETFDNEHNQAALKAYRSKTAEDELEVAKKHLRQQIRAIP